MRRLDCHDAIKRVRRSYEIAVRTVEVFVRIARQEPQHLRQNDLALADIDAMRKELHDVYFVRMFACFESALRHYWRTKVRDTRPLAAVLLSSLAAKRGVPQDTLDVIQEIRGFRNFLIHEESNAESRFTIEEASAHLNTYLARLPLEW